MREMNVKKLICLVTAVLMLFVFVGCVEIEDDPSKEEYSSTEVSTQAKADETFGLNETAVFKELKMTATEIKESSGEDFFEPESGNVFLGVKFTIENISDEEQTISSMLLFDAYVDDVSCDYSLSAACVFDEGIDATIAPGKKVVGWYAVEIPSNWSSFELQAKANWLSNSSATFVFSK